MKNTHRSFDDQLRKRLRSYREQPRPDLWSGIAPHIVSVERPSRRQIWLKRLTALLFLIALMMPQDIPVHISLPRPGSEADSAVRGSQSTKEKQSNAIHDLQSSITPEAPGAERTRQRATVNAYDSDTAQSVFTDMASQKLAEIDPDGSPTRISYGLAEASIVRASSLSEPMKVAIPTFDQLDKPLASNPKVDSRNEQAVITKKEYSLYLTAMPTFGYQRIESNDRDAILIESIKRVRAFSTERLGIRVEAGAQLPVSGRLTASGGLVYFQRRQTIEYTEREVADVVVNSADGPQVVLDAQYVYTQKTLDHELKDIGVQFDMAYHLRRRRNESEAGRPPFERTGRKFSHTIGGGLELHKNLRDLDALPADRRFNDPSLYLFFNAYYRLQYPDGGHVRVILQPTLNYSMYLNKDINTPFYVKPYGLGLNVGFSYNFSFR